ncbi:hypothetical protein V8C86DRAFT_3086219 [Haematococcus lacustris]
MTDLKAAFRAVKEQRGISAPDELIEALRSDGRRQAAHRMLRQKRDSGPTRSTRARSSRLDHAIDRDGSGDHGGGRTSSAAGDSMCGGATSYSHDPGSESGIGDGGLMDC